LESEHVGDRRISSCRANRFRLGNRSKAAIDDKRADFFADGDPTAALEVPEHLGEPVLADAGARGELIDRASGLSDLLKDFPRDSRERARHGFGRFPIR
jgi:hypothetical protein